MWKMTNELMECDRQAGLLILSVQGTGVVSVIRYTRFINLIYLFIYLFIPLFSNFFFIFFPREVAMSHYRAERDFVLCRSSDLFRLGAFVRRKKRFSAVEIKKKKKKRIQKKKTKEKKQKNETEKVHRKQRVQVQSVKNISSNLDVLSRLSLSPSF